jgi:hypothetical protein
MGARQTPSLPSQPSSALICVLIGLVSGVAVGLTELIAPLLRASQTNRLIFVCAIALVVGVVASRVKGKQQISLQG